MKKPCVLLRRLLTDCAASAEAGGDTIAGVERYKVGFFEVET